MGAKESSKYGGRGILGGHAVDYFIELIAVENEHRLRQALRQMRRALPVIAEE